MAHVHRIRSRGQESGPIDTSNPEALAAWIARLRALLVIVRPLVEDATMRSGERVHSRHHLRRHLLKAVRMVEHHVDTLDPSGATPVAHDAASVQS